MTSSINMVECGCGVLVHPGATCAQCGERMEHQPHRQLVDLEEFRDRVELNLLREMSRSAVNCGANGGCYLAGAWKEAAERRAAKKMAEGK